MTPAAYLRLRRIAAGLSIGDVAERLAPHFAARRNAFALIRLWEADGVVADPGDVIRLHKVFVFDVDVYRQLSEEPADRHPRVCGSCGCSEWDACLDGLAGACGWANDALCTRCEARTLHDPAGWMHLAMARTQVPQVAA